MKNIHYSTNEGGVDIDLAKIEAELAAYTPEQLQEELLKIRTRQKVQQKKMQGSASHKSYQQKAQAKRKALVALAKQKGIYDAVNEEAERRANEILSKEAEEEVGAETETA